MPSLDELIPACGELTMQVAALPDVREVPARFAGLDTPTARIERLVGEAFGIYERGGAMIDLNTWGGATRPGRRPGRSRDGDR